MSYHISILKLITNIKNCDWLSKNDLYVEIELGEEKRRTMVKWNDNEPVWNESFLFNIDVKKHLSFYLTIKDEDKYSKSEKIITEKVKINIGPILSTDTDFLSISHGIINYEANKKYKKLQQDNKTIVKYNNKLVDDFNTSQNELDKITKEKERLKEHLFTMKKSIVKVLSQN
tara:strand:+ start:1365 stop:1883 length:519 start_codon:yes stop_codon:yes gene_type:complete